MRSRIIATGLTAALAAGLAGAAAGKPVSRAAALKEQAALMRAWADQERGASARGVAVDEAAARRAAAHERLVRLYSHYDGIVHFGDAGIAPLHPDSVPGGHGGT